MAQSLPLRADLVAGIDVGGTKVHIMDTFGTGVHRYNTADFASLDAVLEDYYAAIAARPARIAIGIAGPRDDDTGAIALTNSSWPAFEPAAAAVKYGIRFATMNDMVATTAGILASSSIDLSTLKPGTPKVTGCKLVVALSTGIGVAAAVWDEPSQRYVIIPSEGGHIGFQPKDEEEAHYLRYLHDKHPHASAELALSGKHGIDNIIDHTLDSLPTQDLPQAIARARAASRPLGAVLLEYATAGTGVDQRAAHTFLNRLGSMLGSVLRDLAMTFKSTGGIYLTGSVAQALGEYWAERTAMNDRFVHEKAIHADWLQHIPIQLVSDSLVAVKGALELAQAMPATASAAASESLAP